MQIIVKQEELDSIAQQIRDWLAGDIDEDTAGKTLTAEDARREQVHIQQGSTYLANFAAPLLATLYAAKGWPAPAWLAAT